MSARRRLIERRSGLGKFAYYAYFVPLFTLGVILRPAYQPHLSLCANDPPPLGNLAWSLL
jgi:hypothetical protein